MVACAARSGRLPARTGDARKARRPTLLVLGSSAIAIIVIARLLLSTTCSKLVRLYVHQGATAVIADSERHQLGSGELRTDLLGYQ